MITKASKNDVRKKRHQHVRNRIYGTAERPRLNVYRSNKHIYAQLINDDEGATVVASSTMDNELGLDKGGDVEAAKQVGSSLAARALEKGYETVIFDRGGYLYHGRIKALADAAREAGLQF
ncbi:50S ribosomal protein L18 [Tuberibacillus sp. Marseille-P3662]|uniref:50S ribosomal protein L18 n=1 Tax=Tuberibacillus sp. Marseille-P3662 TaxID=1965358 RepID=UPI000A1CC4D5|nr:50S ribosomal protein L18 [Tuberibacillus sp. Marseille-P3662]